MQRSTGEFVIADDITQLQEESKRLEKETGKPHPIFVKGEIVEIKGGKFKVYQILKNRLILQPIKY